MTFENAWAKIMAPIALPQPVSEDLMKKIAAAFFTAGKLAQTDETLERLGSESNQGNQP